MNNFVAKTKKFVEDHKTEIAFTSGIALTLTLGVASGRWADGQLADVGFKYMRPVIDEAGKKMFQLTDKSFVEVINYVPIKDL